MENWSEKSKEGARDKSYGWSKGECGKNHSGAKTKTIGGLGREVDDTGVGQ